MPLTDELLRENTLEDPATVKTVELLFTSFAQMPALAACTSLTELTIMSARLPRIPPEVQLVKGTLSSAGQLSSVDVAVRSSSIDVAIDVAVPVHAVPLPRTT